MNSFNGNSSPHKWYVIQTKPGSEHRVKIHLSHQEIEAFLPLLETFEYLHGRLIQKVKPLFPNYLFALLDLNLHYDRVRWTRGVNRLVGSGNGPVPVSEKVIQTIKERMVREDVVRLEEEWKKGEVVQINSGPFKDLMGIFDRKMSEKGRVRILLSLVGVEVAVQISRWQLKKVA